MHWRCQSTVWAIGNAQPHGGAGEEFADLLAVRDLASGMRLLWLPVPEATATTTTAALLSLLVLCRRPLG